MALDSFGLFVHQAQATDGDLQVSIFKTIFDIVTLYGVTFLEEKGHGVSHGPRAHMVKLTVISARSPNKSSSSSCTH